MLGFRPISSAPISAQRGKVSASASQAMPGLGQAAVAHALVQASASQTMPAVTTVTVEGYTISVSQTLNTLSQSVVGKTIASVQSVAAMPMLTVAAKGIAADTARASDLMPALTQVATASVFWNLPDCGWIKPLGRSFDVLLRHTPLGRAWLGFRTAGKRAYRVYQAIAGSFEAAWQALCNLATEVDPRTTVEMISDWETALSLPDPCFPGATTLDERRRNIWFRLDKKRWSKAKDWHQLAAMFGLEIVITPGWYVQKPALYPFCYPKRYDLFPKLGRFRVYIDVTNIPFAGYDYGAPNGAPFQNRGQGYPIPYGFSNPNLTKFMCLIDRVRPANVIVIWNTFPGRLACVPPNGV